MSLSHRAAHYIFRRDMFHYFLYVACGVFPICLAYAAYVILGRLVVLRGLRQLAFRVQMLAHGRTARLGTLLNAHPLALFFSDRLSVEIERELVRLERCRRIPTPYHSRQYMPFAFDWIKLLRRRVERIEQGI